MKSTFFPVHYFRAVSAPLMAMLFVAALFATPNAFAAEDDDEEISITLEKLPKAVRKAVMLATQDGEIEQIELEVEDGMAMYDIEVEVNGGTVELCFDHDGRLVGIEVVEQDEDDEAESGDSEEEEEEEDKEDMSGEDDEEMTDGDDEEMTDEDEEEMTDEGDEEMTDEDEAENEEEGDDKNSAEAGEESSKESSKIATEISADELPKPALAAILKRSGDTELVAVESITEAGATVYEAAWMVDEVKREVTVTADGDVVSEERSVMLEKLPNAVQEVAKAFGDVSATALKGLLVLQ